MKAIKLPKLGTFFVISISDSKLIIKLPKCKFLYFSIINQAENPNKIREYLFHNCFMDGTSDLKAKFA